MTAGALHLTIHPWEVPDVEGFERAFAAFKKERPDGLYVLSGTRMWAIYKRIAGFALKNRLPSIYNNTEAVDAGGLMFYGADVVDSYIELLACGAARRALRKRGSETLPLKLHPQLLRTGEPEATRGCPVAKADPSTTAKSLMVTAAMRVSAFQRAREKASYSERRQPHSTGWPG